VAADDADAKMAKSVNVTLAKLSVFHIVKLNMSSLVLTPGLLYTQASPSVAP
jgi:hypothetical protein